MRLGATPPRGGGAKDFECVGKGGQNILDTS